MISHPPATKEQLSAQLLVVLGKVPSSDRARFARTQLVARHPRLVEAFDAISPQRARKSVLFISLRPQHAREPKLAAAARLAVWDPLLLYTGRANYDVTTRFSFQENIPDYIELILAGWLFPGPLIHLFADTGAVTQIFCFTKQKRIILDLFDTNSGMKWFPAGHANLERQAIAAADGMTHRDLRVQYLHKLHGYQLPPHNLFLLDPFTGNSPQLSTRTNSARDLRVVSAGWVGDEDTSILQTAHALCAARIHVHFYPYPAGSSLVPYRRLERISDYFHLEEPVFGPEYTEHLLQYDFGLCPCEPHIFGEESSRYTSDYFRGCGSSRIIDYFQAGLGLIGSPEIRFQHFCARRYASSLVPANLEFLRNPRPILEAARRRKRVRTARDFESIMIPASAVRLGAFYERVVSKESPTD
jgi:hypothetical protein